MFFKAYILSNGGDLVSTWVAKLEVHVEDVTTLVKNVTKLIVAKNDRNFAVAYSNDTIFGGEVEVAKAA